MSDILFVVFTAPYENGFTDEAHDLIMASTAYGHHASVMFEEQGVFQLIAKQNPPEGQKNAAKRIQGFEFFDVEPLYACQLSVDESKIKVENLVCDVQLVSPDTKQQLIDNADFVVRL